MHLPIPLEEQRFSSKDPKSLSRYHKADPGLLYYFGNIYCRLLIMEAASA